MIIAKNKAMKSDLFELYKVKNLTQVNASPKASPGPVNQVINIRFIKKKNNTVHRYIPKSLFYIITIYLTRKS